MKEWSKNTFKLYIGNLSPTTTNEDLRKVFSKFGSVVEAVAFTEKGFGFVHMSNEDEGQRAMKGLYKYCLNGQEMIVQNAINPKKATVASHPRKATIGKGITTLDDFEDFNEFDSRCVDIEHRRYSEKRPSNSVSPDYVQLNTRVHPAWGLNSRPTSQPIVNSITRKSEFNTDADNELGGAIDKYLNSDDFQDGIFNQSNNNSNKRVSGSNSSYVDRSHSSWQESPQVNGSTHTTCSQANSTSPLQEFSLKQQPKSTHSLSNLTAQFDPLRPLQSSYQEIPRSTNFSMASTVKSESTPNMQSNSTIQYSKPAVYQEGNSQYLGKEQNNNSDGQRLQNNNSDTIGVPNIVSLPQTIPKANSTTMSSNAPSTSAVVCNCCHEVYNNTTRIPKILGCTHTYCLNCLCLSVERNGTIKCPGGCGVETSVSSAGVAGLTTNQGILSMLNSLGCSPENIVSSNNKLVNGASSLEEICVHCTGTRQDQPLAKCKQDNHVIVYAKDAVQLITAELRPLLEKSLTLLNNTISLRANNKARVECTIAALAKFSEELQTKLVRDSADERILESMLNNLLDMQNNLCAHSYGELLQAYHMVDTGIKDLHVKYDHLVRAAAVCEAFEALTVKLDSNSYSAIKSFGLRQNELFYMDQSLLEHARAGNYANVLLQYMVADLLNTRVSHVFQNNKTPEKCSSDVNMADDGKTSNSVSSVESRPDSRVSPFAVSIADNVYSTQNGDGAIISDADSVSDSFGNDEIKHVLLTTEAIEAAHLSDNNKKLSVFLDTSLSFGLSDIAQRVVDDDEKDRHDLNQSLLEGSPYIETPRNMQSSAPSPCNFSNKSPSPPLCMRNSTDSSGASSDSGVACKPVSYLDALKKPAKPQAEVPPPTKLVVPFVKIPIQSKQPKCPHAWIRISVDDEIIGRVVFQLRPDKAPKMCENFLGLITGKPGYGYKDTHFFKNSDGYLAGGDVEYDDGTGGYSIYDREKFEADLCPLKDEVGMIRFKGNGTSDSGKGMVGSQFMIWYAEREFKKFSYSLVFGRVVDGLEVIVKASEVDLSEQYVKIADCGATL